MTQEAGGTHFTLVGEAEGQQEVWADDKPPKPVPSDVLLPAIPHLERFNSFQIQCYLSKAVSSNASAQGEHFSLQPYNSTSLVAQGEEGACIGLSVWEEYQVKQKLWKLDRLSM